MRTQLFSLFKRTGLTSLLYAKNLYKLLNQYELNTPIGRLTFGCFIIGYRH